MKKNYVLFFRKKRKLTLEELKEKSRIPIAILSMLEKNYIELVDNRFKFLLAKALDTEVENLFPEEILPGPRLRKTRRNKVR